MSKNAALRCVIRGYYHLYNSGNAYLVRKILSDLSFAYLGDKCKYASKFFFGASYSSAELIVKQFLLQNFCDKSMKHRLLYAFGKKCPAVIVLPVQLRSVFRENNIIIDESMSRLLWAFALVLRYANNIYKVARIMMRLEVINEKFESLGRYVYFLNLANENIPSGLSDEGGYDICTWYTKSPFKVKDLETIAHSKFKKKIIVNGVAIVRLPEPFCVARGYKEIFYLWIWSLIAIIRAGFDLLIGRWWNALMLYESVCLKIVQLLPTQYLAKDYLFPYSGSTYRPMWTYDVEQRGARVVCYQYSTSEQPKLVGGYQPHECGLKGATWSTYFVWDLQHKIMVRRDVGNEPNIYIVGPIWFSDSNEQIVVEPRSVAVFDNSPHRLAYHLGFSTLADYLVLYPEHPQKFLEDIQSVMEEFDLNVVLKLKRDIGKRARKNYKTCLADLSKQSNFKIITSTTSPIKVIRESVAVISIPFTSTAVYAKSMGVPSIYYDPTGWILKNDPAARGIPIISGIAELRLWASSIKFAAS